jgi:hypothetical protein
LIVLRLSGAAVSLVTFAGAGVAFLLAMAFAQVFAFHAAAPELRHMLRFYTEICVFNVWTALVTLTILGAALLAAGKVRPLFFVASFIAWFLLERDQGAAAAIAKWPQISAQDFSVLMKQLPRADAGMHTASAFDFGYEHWVIPDRASEAYASEKRATVRFGYNYGGAWPARAAVPSEHFERLCRGDCDYLRTLGIKSTVTFTANDTSLSRLCDKPADEILPTCFDKAGEAQSHEARATVWLLR